MYFELQERNEPIVVTRLSTRVATKIRYCAYYYCPIVASCIAGTQTWILLEIFYEYHFKNCMLYNGGIIIGSMCGRVAVTQLQGSQHEP